MATTVTGDGSTTESSLELTLNDTPDWADESDQSDSFPDIDFEAGSDAEGLLSEADKLAKNAMDMGRDLFPPGLLNETLAVTFGEIGKSSEYLADIRIDKETIEAQFPNAPELPTLKPVTTITLDDIPAFPARAPSIRTVTPVAALTDTPPDAPILPDRTSSLPEAPSKDGLPDPITLRNLSLPDAPDIIIPDFTGVEPGMLDEAPSTNISYSENFYESTLLSELNNKLIEHVQGLNPTGLSPEIEQQIWDRARERTTAATQGAIIQVSRSSAAAGWDQPVGAQYEAEQQARQKAVEEDVAESRNIAIKQAELELQNFQFAFTQGIALEGQMINYTNEVANRRLDVAKYTVQAAISLYELKVSYFNAGVELYKTKSTVYKDQIQSAVAKVEIYKAELDGQKLISEINAQDINNYKSQVEAVLSLYEVYKSELEGVKLLLEHDNLAIQRYESEIKGYAEKVKAKSLEYEGYKAELSGESLKVEQYKSLVDAFESRMSAIKASTEAKVAKLDADIKVNQEMPLEESKILTETFKIATEAEAKRLESLMALYKTDAEIFNIESNTEFKKLDASLKARDQDLDFLTAKAGVEVDKLKIASDRMSKAADTMARVTETQGRIAAQIASARLAQHSFSVGRSKSESDSTSQNKSFSCSSSFSRSENYNYSG